MERDAGARGEDDTGGMDGIIGGISVRGVETGATNGEQRKFYENDGVGSGICEGWGGGYEARVG